MEFKPESIIIAVMGVTGSGKSTFIQPFTEMPIAVGTGLDSCTRSCEIYKCSIARVPEFYLIDTPGFDDTGKTFTEVLRELAAWLTAAYSKDVKLTGVIFAHRISDSRMSIGTARSIGALKNLCGDNDLGGVVLTTTFHHSISHEHIQKREAELKDREDFWGYFMARGSRVFRQDDGKVSAERIIYYLIDRKRRLVLQLQLDMVGDHKTLDQTAAGAEVQQMNARTIRDIKLRIADLEEEMQEASAANNQQWQIEIKENLEKLNLQIFQCRKDNARLQVAKEKLWEEEDAKKDNERAVTQRDILQIQQHIDACRLELEDAESNNLDASTIEQLRMELYNLQQREQMSRRKINSRCILM